MDTETSFRPWFLGSDKLAAGSAGTGFAYAVRLLRRRRCGNGMNVSPSRPNVKQSVMRLACRFIDPFAGVINPVSEIRTIRTVPHRRGLKPAAVRITADDR